MVHAQGQGKIWWYPNRRRIGVLRASKNSTATSQKNHGLGQPIQAHIEMHQGNWKKDHPCKQQRACPQKEGSAPHDWRTSCLRTEAPHGSSGQVFVQDGSSPSHRGDPQCGRTPPRGGQQLQCMTRGKNRSAGGDKARGGARTPQDTAKHSMQREQRWCHWDPGGKEAPHEGRRMME